MVRLSVHLDKCQENTAEISELLINEGDSDGGGDDAVQLSRIPIQCGFCQPTYSSVQLNTFATFFPYLQLFLFCRV
jgi:hypothetical protein